MKYDIEKMPGGGVFSIGNLDWQSESIPVENKNISILPQGNLSLYRMHENAHVYEYRNGIEYIENPSSKIESALVFRLYSDLDNDYAVPLIINEEPTFRQIDSSGTCLPGKPIVGSTYPSIEDVTMLGEFALTSNGELLHNEGYDWRKTSVQFYGARAACMINNTIIAATTNGIYAMNQDFLGTTKLLGGSVTTGEDCVMIADCMNHSVGYILRSGSLYRFTFGSKFFIEPIDTTLSDIQEEIIFPYIQSCEAGVTVFSLTKSFFYPGGKASTPIEKPYAPTLPYPIGDDYDPCIVCKYGCYPETKIFFPNGDILSGDVSKNTPWEIETKMKDNPLVAISMLGHTRSSFTLIGIQKDLSILISNDFGNTWESINDDGSRNYGSRIIHFADQDEADERVAMSSTGICGISFGLTETNPLLITREGYRQDGGTFRGEFTSRMNALNNGFYPTLLANTMLFYSKQLNSWIGYSENPGTVYRKTIVEPEWGGSGLVRAGQVGGGDPFDPYCGIWKEMVCYTNDTQILSAGISSDTETILVASNATKIVSWGNDGVLHVKTNPKSTAFLNVCAIYAATNYYIVLTTNKYFLLLEKDAKSYHVISCSDSITYQFFGLRDAKYGHRPILMGYDDTKKEFQVYTFQEISYNSIGPLTLIYRKSGFRPDSYCGGDGMFFLSHQNKILCSKDGIHWQYVEDNRVPEAVFNNLFFQKGLLGSISSNFTIDSYKMNDMWHWYR